MTTLDNSRTSGRGSFLGNFTANTFGAFSAWNDARITRKALSALTARELDDIGLTPGDIETIATGR